jgi:hypothetical protein
MITNSNGLKKSKFEMNQLTLKFKTNVEKALLEDGLNQTKKDDQGSRYECIYKNTLRDIRQFYKSRFNKFV